MSKEALKLALEAFEAETDPNWKCNSYHPKIWEAITAIKQALAASVQEPVAILKGIDEYGPVVDWCKHWVTVPIGTKFYTTPPAAQRPWIGLTDEEAQWIYDNGRTPSGMMEMVEAKLKERNNG